MVKRKKSNPPVEPALPEVQKSSPRPLPRWMRIEAWVAGLGLGLAILGVGSGWATLQAHQDRFYPGLTVNGTPVGSLTKLEAHALLSEKRPLPALTTLQLVVDDITLASSSAELGLHYDLDSTLNAALAYGKTGPLPRRLLQILKLQVQPLALESALAFDPLKVETMVAIFKTRVDTPNQEPQATLTVSHNPQSLKINPGQPGRAVNSQTTMEHLQAAAGHDSPILAADVASVGAQLSPDEITQARTRVTRYVGKRAVFRHSDASLTLTDQDMVSLLALPEGFNQTAIDHQVAEWQTKITREPQDAAFEYDPTSLKVSRFVPPRNGLQLDTGKISDLVNQALTELAAETAPATLEKDLPLAIKPPTKTLESTNKLGIKELMGFGDSEYDHSIPTRIYNVSLTTGRINNTIVKPGEEFSFNRTLGDVSAETGFKPAYVIKDGQTVLGDGGGVCQVSTTVFRSALNAGLPITKRKAHSYRVSYYELNQKPGLDATVYSGDVDLRFINDTGHHLLIHAEANSQDLYMKAEIYGTSDGRHAEILDHKTWDARPAPAPVYIPDPTLPPGKLKQIDWAASGIRASFRYVVKDKSGAVIRDQEFFSNYIPWSAKYLKGV